MARLAIRRSMVVALMASLVGVTAAPADEASPAGPGPRVRLTAPTVSGKRLIGTLVRLDEATLTLQQEGAKATLIVPRGSITRIELSRHRGRRGKGAGIGALVGIGAAVVLGVAAGENCDFPAARPENLDLVERLDRSFCFGKGEIALAAALVTVPLGTLLGYAAAPGERWVVTSPDRFRMSVAPVRGGGVGASLSFRF